MKKYFKYKGVTVNAFGLPVLFKDKKVIKHGESKRKYFQYRQFNFNFSLSKPFPMTTNGTG